MTFTVRSLVGTAGELHRLVVPGGVGPEVWCMSVTGAAVVLGSRQTPDMLDAAAVARAGVDVVQRRSGGGAVLVVPDELVWIDVVVPAGHPAWRADIAVSMEVVGDAWIRALASFGAGALRVHRGGMVRTPWSDLVCFDGVGPGEVVQGEAKLVGISQRRTRAAARFQCAVHLRYVADALPALLAGPLPAAPRRPVATLPPVPSAELAAALASALTG